MDIANPTAFLAIARQRRQVVMRSRCEVRRPNGERVFDPATGAYSDPGYTVIYEGICQVRPASSVAPAKRNPDVGEAEVVTNTYEVMVPYSCPRVELEDDVAITESDDAWVVARGAMPVTWVEYDDNATHRSVLATALDRPAVNDA